MFQSRTYGAATTKMFQQYTIIEIEILNLEASTQVDLVQDSWSDNFIIFKFWHLLSFNKWTNSIQP